MKMSVSISALLGVATKAKAIDVLTDLEKVLATHKCSGVQITIGIPGGVNERGKENDEHEQAGPVRTERGQAAADDFADDEAPAESEDVKPAGRKPRSDAGKPRGKRGAAEGSAAEGPERGAGRSQGGDAAGGDGSRGASRGGGEGKRQGDGGERAGEGSGGRTRRADVRDDKAAQVAADEEDWGAGGSDEDAADLTNQEASTDPEFDTFEEGEAWWAKTPDSDGWPASLMPEGALNKGALSRIMSDHFRANGGKSRTATFDLLAKVTGAEDLDKVHADDFDKLARAMLRDTAKLRHGVKKPGK